MNSHTRSPSHHNTWPTVTLRHLYNLSCQEASLLLALNPVLHNGKWVGCSIHFCIYSFLLNFRHCVAVHEDTLTLRMCVWSNIAENCTPATTQESINVFITDLIAIIWSTMEESCPIHRPWWHPGSFCQRCLIQYCGIRNGSLNKACMPEFIVPTCGTFSLSVQGLK